MSLLLLSGKAGSGKTTFAEYLTSSYPEKCVSFALADKLKEMTFKLLKLFNVPISSISDLDNRETKEKYRKYLQQIGTEVMRSTFGDTFWCEQLFTAIKQHLADGKIVIISDVRFPNEQHYFQTLFDDVKCIMIRRDIVDHIKTTHESENTTNLHIDEVIFNNGSIESFKRLIDNIANKYISDDALIESIDIEPEPETIERAINIDNITESNNTIKNVAANDEKFISMMTSNNDKNSSQQLGVIGEKYVLELLQQIKPRNETILVSSMPHVADLHSIDYINNIFWVIEVKNKSNLTPEDVDKFKRDLERMTQQHANDKLKCVGLFLSLRSTSIPKIGDLYINGNEIYLSKTYFGPETIKIVFNFVEQYQTLLNSNSSINPQSVQETTNASRPSFTAEDLELLALLNTEYQHITRDLELYASMRTNCTDNLQHIEELTTSARMKQRLIYCLNRQLSSSDDIIDKTTESIQYNAFIDYIKTQSNKSSIKKNVILQRFPALMTSINRIGWNEYRDEAWTTSHSEPRADNEATINEQTIDATKHVCDDSLLDYISKLPSKNKLLKKDVLKICPQEQKDIQTYGWPVWRDHLWEIAHQQPTIDNQ